ncbi:branched-chain amino acid permease [Neisseria meningitidis]|nr:branched-chain amino acid permease [Neisseria meningitidis]
MWFNFIRCFNTLSQASNGLERGFFYSGLTKTSRRLPRLGSKRTIL